MVSGPNRVLTTLKSASNIRISSLVTPSKTFVWEWYEDVGRPKPSLVKGRRSPNFKRPDSAISNDSNARCVACLRAMPCCTSHPPTTPSSNSVENSRRFVNEPSRSSYDHAAWNLIPTMVWANVTRWLTCTERRVVRRVMRAFVSIRYRYAQCTCLKRPSQVLRTLSDARYIFWDRFNDCVLSFVPHPPLPEAWADEPYVSRLTQHYAGWATRLRHAYERWVQRVNDFRRTHCMYDGDLPTVVLNEHAYPHDEFTIVDGVKHVRFRLNHWSCSMKYARFATESGRLIPTTQYLMAVYNQFRSDWGSPGGPHTCLVQRRHTTCVRPHPTDHMVV